MNERSERQTLVNSLKQITPEMQEQLENLKEWGTSELERSDFVWHILLQSFSTWGGARGYAGLIGNQDNYGRVTFDALSALDANERSIVLLETFRTAKIRYAETKARLMAHNYDLIATMGGPLQPRSRRWFRTLPLACAALRQKMIYRSQVEPRRKPYGSSS